MRNRLRIHCIATAFGLLLACSAGAQQAGTASPERVEVVGTKAEVSEWYLAQSPHFSVYSDAREEDVAQLLDNLEKLDHLLRIYTQPVRSSEPQEPRLTLYFHSRASTLRDVSDGMPANAVGLYSSCAAGVRGFGVQFERIPGLADEQLEKSALNDTLSYAFEAYARHFLYRHTDIRAPAFFIDGFALYFSSVRFSEHQMVVGRVPPSVGGYLHFLDQGRSYSLEYEDVLQERLADAHNYAGDAGVRLEFEARSWLLTHYMLSSDDRRKRLSRYLALTAAGTAPAAAFEKSFGVKVADIGAVLWRYGHKGTEVLRVALPTLPAARVSFRSLPLAAGEFVLPDAALRSCPSRQAGESLLKKVSDLAARFPHDKLGRLTLSRAQIDWGDPREALPRLEELLREDPASFESEYLAGLAHLRLAAAIEGDDRRGHLQAAQRHLRHARELDPRSPEAAFAAFQAEVAATDAPGDAALSGVVSAWQTAREVDALAKAAVLASAYAGRADEAYQTLASLAQDTRDKPMAAWAREWHGRLEAGVTRASILAEMRRTAVPDAPFKEWTIDKESVLQAVERAYGMQAAESVIRAAQEKDKPGMPANVTPGTGKGP